MKSRNQPSFENIRDKRKFIRNMFDSFAPRYDLFNRAGSLLLVPFWRKVLNQHIRPGDQVLDVCTGTGTQVFLMAPRVLGKGRGSIVGIDFSGRMLEIARKKSRDLPWKNRVIFRQASAEKLPFANGSFDVVSCEFAMRNVSDIAPKVLSEMHRVLKPGGRVLILELTRPHSLFMAAAHRLYLKMFIPLWGRLILGEDRGPRYLKESIGEFYSTTGFTKLMGRAGFNSVKAKSLTGGIVHLFQGNK